MKCAIKSMYICVKDMERAIRFYENFFEISVSVRDEIYSVFEIDGFRLGLFAFDKMNEKHTFGSNCIPSIEVESLEVLERKIKNYNRVFPLTKIGENYVAEFEDSEGNHIEITAPVKIKVQGLSDENDLSGKNILSGENVLSDNDILSDKNVLSNQKVLSDENVFGDRNIFSGKNDLNNKNVSCDSNTLSGENSFCDKNILTGKNVVNNKNVMDDIKDKVVKNNRHELKVQPKYITLKTDRLELRPLSFKELIDINIKNYDELKTKIEREALISSTKNAIAKKIVKMENVNESLHNWYTYWLIVDKETSDGIGFIGFKGIPDENGYVEVGYSISPLHRQKGLMTEALKAMIKWTISEKDCKGIIAYALISNLGSHKVLTNCGFKDLSSDEYIKFYRLKL